MLKAGSCTLSPGAESTSVVKSLALFNMTTPAAEVCCIQTFSANKPYGFVRVFTP